MRVIDDDIDEEAQAIVPPLYNYDNPREIPINTNPELILFCRFIYEFRSKRLMRDRKSIKKYLKLIP